MVGGTYAFTQYTGIKRYTKDIDIFCKSGDYPKILHALADQGFKTEITDDRWLAKATRKTYFADIIFGAVNGVFSVDDSWFEYAPDATILNIPVKLVAPVEFVWSKAFRQQRYRSDVADVYHIFLKQGKTFDWKRLLLRMENQWEVLFAHLINFRFIYPSERGTVPKWLMQEMCGRIKHQLEMPISKKPICRGQLFSSTEYEVDINEWGYKNLTF
ncbi:MAG: hypothetical protein RI947_125 [Candidatus Parcubacteria bacterium]|jgi:hypothetical protein